MRKLLCLLTIVMSMLCFLPISNASPFTQIDRKALSYHNKIPLTLSYDSADGKLTLQLTSSNPADRLKASLNGRVVFDYAFHNTDNGWWIRVFRDQASNKLFIALTSYNRCYVLGYNNALGKIVCYVDSKNYYSGFSYTYPRVYAYKDGSLILALCDGYDDVPVRNIHQYQLDWNSSTKNFSYSDLGTVPTLAYDEIQ